MKIPAWQHAYLEPILAVGFLTIGFIIYHFVSHSDKLLDRFKASYGDKKGLTYFIWLSRYLGAVVMGFIPLGLMLWLNDRSLMEYGLNTRNSLTSFYWILGLTVLILPLTYTNARKKESYEFYPLVREKNWSKSMILHNSFTWLAYLFGYELMFRGILLFATVAAFGPWPAIILNAAIYALVHVPKNLRETIGAIPFGIVLCLITLTTGNILVAFAVHSVMALSTFLFALKFNPEMKII